MMSVLIKLRTVNYHLVALTNRLFRLFQKKLKNQIYKKNYFLIIFLLN
jgi:hypothetical protein